MATSTKTFLCFARQPDFPKPLKMEIKSICVHYYTVFKQQEKKRNQSSILANGHKHQFFSMLRKTTGLSETFEDVDGTFIACIITFKKTKIKTMSCNKVLDLRQISARYCPMTKNTETCHYATFATGLSNIIEGKHRTPLALPHSNSKMVKKQISTKSLIFGKLVQDYM